MKKVLVTMEQARFGKDLGAMNEASSPSSQLNFKLQPFTSRNTI